MPLFDQQLIGSWIRWAHVVSVAVLLAGGVGLWVLCLRTRVLGPGDKKRRLVRAAQGYEIVFWIALDLVVMTGIEQIGAMGSGIPTWTTPWGIRMTVKLVAALALVLLSLPRSTLVVGLTLMPDGNSTSRALNLFTGFYTVTLVLLVGILIGALSLVYG